MNRTSFDDKIRQGNLPLQYKIYKGVKGKLGAMRFNLKRAWQDTNDIKKAEGVIFLDMVPASGPNTYDWENQKMTIALGLTDISKILYYFRAPGDPMFKDRNDPEKRGLVIYHDKFKGIPSKEGKHVTTLKVSQSSDTNNYFFTIYQTSNNQNNTATVTASPNEAIIIATLLQAAIPKILSW